MRFRKEVCGIILICALMLPVVARAAAVDWIVATVNGDIILNSELQERVQILKRAAPNLDLNDPEKKSQAEHELLQQIIRERLTDQEIKRMKITVSKSDLDQAIANIRQENGFSEDQLSYVLSQQGVSMEKFRAKVQQEMERARLIEKVFKSKTLVTDAQVNERLQHPESLPVTSDASAPKDRRRLAVIFIPAAEESGGKGPAEAEKQATQIRSRLQSGADFAEMARKYSKGPAAEEGGDIGTIASSELAAPIEKATRDLKPGDVTDVVKTPTGCYILKALSPQSPQKAESQPPNEPDMRERVRRQLMQEEVNRKYEQWVKNLETKAYIVIHLKPGS